MTNHVLAATRTTQWGTTLQKRTASLTANSAVEQWARRGQSRIPARSWAHKVLDQLYSVIPQPGMTLSTAGEPRGYQRGTVNQAATPGYCPARPSEIRAGISSKASSLRHHYSLPLGNRPTGPEPEYVSFFLEGHLFSHSLGIIVSFFLLLLLFPFSVCKAPFSLVRFMIMVTPPWREYTEGGRLGWESWSGLSVPGNCYGNDVSTCYGSATHASRPCHRCRYAWVTAHCRLAFGHLIRFLIHFLRSPSYFFRLLLFLHLLFYLLLRIVLLCSMLTFSLPAYPLPVYIQTLQFLALQIKHIKKSV